MSELKVISISNTLNASNQLLPKHFVSKKSEHLTVLNYPEIGGFFNERSMVCLLYLSEEYKDGRGYSFLLNTDVFDLWSWSITDLSDLIVEKVIREFASRIQATCLCVKGSEQTTRVMIDRFEPLLEWFKYLAVIDSSQMGVLKEIEIFKNSSSMQEIAALELVCYDRLFECVLNQDLKNIVSEVRTLDVISGFFSSDSGRDSRKIISDHARRISKKAQRGYPQDLKNLVQELAITRYHEKGEHISSMSLAIELNQSKGVIEQFLDKDAGRPSDETINRWIKEVAPQGVNKRGRPRKR